MNGLYCPFVIENISMLEMAKMEEKASLLVQMEKIL